MTLLASWPTTTDDSGTKTDGTIVNDALFDAIKASVEDQVHSSVNTTIKPKTITDEVVAARGSKTTLDERLDVALNNDGTLKSGVIQRLTTDTTSTPNSGGAETDLASYTLAAAALASSGQLIRVTVVGSFAANANVKTLRVYVDGVLILTPFAAAHNAGVWRVQFELIRTGATTGHMTLLGAYGTGPVCPTQQGSVIATWANSNIVKVTGQGTASSDLVRSVMLVEFLG